MFGRTILHGSISSDYHRKDTSVYVHWVDSSSTHPYVIHFHWWVVSSNQTISPELMKYGNDSKYDVSLITTTVMSLILEKIVFYPTYHHNKQRFPLSRYALTTSSFVKFYQVRRWGTVLAAQKQKKMNKKGIYILIDGLIWYVFL